MKSIVSKVLAIFFMMVSLLPQMDTYELSKLPHLLDHYQELNNQNPYRFTFLRFLSLHYGPEKKNHTDKHQDKGCLPFQHHYASSLFFMMVSHLNASVSLPSFIIINKPFYKTVYYPVYLSSIWQPPRQF